MTEELKNALKSAISEMNHDNKDYAELHLSKDECEYIIKLMDKN